MQFPHGVGNDDPRHALRAETGPARDAGELHRRERRLDTFRYAENVASRPKPHGGAVHLADGSTGRRALHLAVAARVQKRHLRSDDAAVWRLNARDQRRQEDPRQISAAGRNRSDGGGSSVSPRAHKYRCARVSALGSA